MENFFSNFESELFPQFSSYLRRLGRSELTIQFYHQYLSNFVKFTDLRVEDLQNKKIFESKFSRLWGREITNNTRTKYLQSMRRFIDFVIEYELCELEKNVTKKVEKPQIKRQIIPAMELEDINNIFTIMGKIWSGNILERNIMIIKTFLYAGLRRGELLALTRECIHTNYILVKGGKGDKDRVVFIPESFSRELQNFLMKHPHHSAVFINKFGEQISLMVIRRIFDEINKKMKVHIYPHRLRHEYGTRLMELGIEPSVIRDQMGHSDIATTNKYIGTRNNRRFEAVQRLEY